MTSNERAARSDTKTVTRAKNRSGVIRNYCPCRLIPHPSHLVKEERFASRRNIRRLFANAGCSGSDESQNPTQSFKARGMSVGFRWRNISALQTGRSQRWQRRAAPYAATLHAPDSKPRLHAPRYTAGQYYRMPRDRCPRNLDRRLITDCAAEIGRRKENWFDVSTLKEPYRIEEKKTLGYELAEQLKLGVTRRHYLSTGGGPALIGMWKAFDEMENRLDRPKTATDVLGPGRGLRADRSCVRSGRKLRRRFPNAHTLAAGLRVPKAIGDFSSSKFFASRWGRIAVSDEEMIRVAAEVASKRRTLRRSGRCSLFCGTEVATLVR